MQKSPGLSKDNSTVLMWAVCASLLLLYLAFPTMNYYWDGIAFAQAIEQASSAANTSLVHPNHLFYNFAGYFFYKLLRVVDPEIRAVTALQLLNNIFAVLSAAVIFQILRKVTRSRSLAVWLTLLFSLSATWWKYSTDADAYIISVFFMLCCFYLILPGSRSRPFLLAVTFSLAMLFHQLAFLFGIVLLVGFWRESRSVKRVIVFAVTTFVITAGIYVFAFYVCSQEVTLPRFAKWITNHSPDASFTFSLKDNFFYTLRGHFRLFVSGRASLLKGLISPWVGILIGAFAVSVVLLFYAVFKKFTRPGTRTLQQIKSEPNAWSMFQLSLLWVLVYLVFLFFWLPHNTFYRLFYLPALILLLGVFAAHRPQTKPGPSRLALFVVALGLANFIFFIFPYTHAEKFPPVGFAFKMTKHWQPDTVIYYSAENADNLLFQYFNPKTSWRRLTSFADLEKALREETAPVWLEASALAQLKSDPLAKEWLEDHIAPTSVHKLDDPNFNITFVRLMP
jgi:hypothetical protein